MPRRALLLCVVLAAGVVVAVAAARTAGARDRRVATDGRDAGDCIAAACATLRYAYKQSAPGDVVRVAAGTYAAQEVPAGSHRITFRGAHGTVLRALDNRAGNVTFDGIDIDAGFAVTQAFGSDGDGVTFRNGRIGNVTDEKGAMVNGARFTFDNVVFHDVRVTAPTVHNECVFAVSVPGMTVRNSTFSACATMDLFFTSGWWSPPPAAYGGITLENNVFGHSTMPEPGSWHYYSVFVGALSPAGSGPLTSWVVRNNTFEIPASVDHPGAAGSRWVGNLGAWTCVPGMAYRRNVGTKCGATDKKVVPASSTATRTAPYRWADPAHGDFHLRAGSPAIGAAERGDVPARDRDGRARDRRPDAGAYEFGAKGS